MVGLIFISFLISIIVSLGWIYYFWQLDKHEKEPVKIIAITFALGAIVALVVPFIEDIGLRIFGISFKDLVKNSLDNIGFLFFYLILVVGVVEELAKFIPVRFYAFRTKYFNEPMDGLIYASASAAGFTFVENMGYIFTGFIAGYEEGMIMAFVRVLTSPVHILFASYWGIALGLYKKNPAKKDEVIKGFIIAAVLHGLYDFFAFLNFFVGLFAIIVFTLILLIRKVDYLSRISPFNKANYLLQCKYCEGLIPVNIQFCINCGKSTEWIDVKDKLSLKYFCGKCKNQINLGQKFCTNCGTKINWK